VSGARPPVTTVTDALTVRVPATSANLGPGFDALAVALDVHMTASVAERDRCRVHVDGCGVDELPDDEGNLVWRAFAAYCGWAGVPVPDVSLRASSDIPLERGMGSSSAAAVAGAALARALVAGTPGARRADDAELVRLVAPFEGHADNAAAAVLGGLVVCTNGRVLRLEPSAALRPVLCIPEQRLATSLARGLLPDVVAHADAAANGARAAVVLAGLAGAVAWDPAAMHDVLHEPARFAAMPDSGRLVGTLREAGVAACLSGAGPAVLAVVASGDPGVLARIRAAAGHGWRVRPSRWDRSGAAVHRRAAVGCEDATR